MLDTDDDCGKLGEDGERFVQRRLDEQKQFNPLTQECTKKALLNMILA